MRVRSYGLPLSAPARAYWQRVCESAGVAAWIAQALAEKTFLAEAEPYRRAR
jgi:glutathione S-transferase